MQSGKLVRVEIFDYPWPLFALARQLQGNRIIQPACVAPPSRSMTTLSARFRAPGSDSTPCTPLAAEQRQCLPKDVRVEVGQAGRLEGMHKDRPDRASAARLASGLADPPVKKI